MKPTIQDELLDQLLANYRAERDILHRVSPGVPVTTNLMVMEPGAYKFTDYWKLGLPMLIWFFIIAVFVVPMIWSF